MFAQIFRERRTSAREPTTIHTEVVFAAGRTRVPCVIRNLSSGGAKLEVASVKGIPQTFDLVIPNRPTLPCRVVWRSPRELGVAFESRR